MKKFTMVTGGARSGKSDYAQNQVQQMIGKRTFIATCPKIDSEMDNRILRHQKGREEHSWQTLEEEIDLSLAIKKSEGVVLIDCLTLWINNLMYEAEKKSKTISENEVKVHCMEVIESIKSYPHSVFVVSNEVGMGVIPDNRAGRLFVDLVGRCNQTMAQAADEVVWMVSGIPQVIKSLL